MKKLNLLVFDANIVIILHELEIWDKAVKSCDIYLSGTVIDLEAKYWEDNDGIRHPINLSNCINQSEIRRFDLDASAINVFRHKYGAMYIEKLDPGETESLAFLFREKDKFSICSSDAIVYRLLGAEFERERGLSLEEILIHIGLQRNLPYQYTKEFRERYSDQGFREGFQGSAF